MHLGSPLRRWSVSLLLIACALPGCASARNKLAWGPFGDRIKDRENRYNFAQVMERNGDIHRAEQSYRKLTAEAPKDARYYQRLGVVLIRQGKPNEGIDNLRKAHDLDQDNIAILNDLGYAYTVEGEYERAESVLRNAMKLDPRDVRTQNNLAMTLGYMGKTEEAYDMFRRNADEGTARNNLAYIYAQTGHVDLAVKEYSRALSHSPSNKSAAEAIVQLNTLNRSLANSTPKETQKVQLASDETVEKPPVVLRRGKATKAPESSSDLVQLLGEVELADEAEEEPSVGRAKLSTTEISPVDYDWSPTP